MPIITKKNGYAPVEEVVFASIGLDESGRYAIDNSIGKEGLPSSLDPLQDPEFTSFITPIEQLEDSVIELDYSEVVPENREQILRITGEGQIRKKVYLSTHGDGVVTTGRPQPMPKPGEIHVYGNEIRQGRDYKRVRENGLVIGWKSYNREVVRGTRGKERG